MTPTAFSKSLLLILSAAAVLGQEPEAEVAEDPVLKHQDGSSKVADEQDELSADVQQLTIEQTVPEVIELLKEVEEIMDEATDLLTDYDTGGETIAAQTEVIEKIHAAAKERQKQQGSGQAGGAMMDMMERMMGKQSGEQPGKEKGDQPGEKGGQGQEGESESANEAAGGVSGGAREQRPFKKNAGLAGRSLPDEFQKALDAYNRGATSIDQ